MLAKILFIFGLVVSSNTRSIHRYELGDRYYYLKALKQQEAARRLSDYYQPVDDYNFGYSVHDQYTGDIKSQKEARKGGVVQGSYELLDADGYKRIVDYTADDINGFNAFVRRVPFGSTGGRFIEPFATPAPSFATAAPFRPALRTPQSNHRFGPRVTQLYPYVTNNLNNYVSDYFNGYSEGDFHQYY
ncbi:unnamed protein product [Hermetia illucens]|uniref:Uncharacterized protein n=1 Tax=Hermetia illucens TaxID=343691 RepID=A0A7R8YY54_HERIL|nr:pupal cuticle protein Edg-84A-like [Hermetia illucens]CAD7086490.1 unnamed protein product [Hermetia illucens]